MRRRDALLAMAAAGVACPLRASAQSASRTVHVALFLAGNEGAVARQRAAIVERLAARGFVEGRNLRVTHRIGSINRGVDERVARDLVASRPDALLVDTTPLALRIREATSSIPTIFTGVGDPVAAGLIKDFARPGGMFTGIHFSQLEIGAKRLEALRELLPAGRRVMLARQIAGIDADTLPHLHRVASRLGFELTEINADRIQGFPGTLWASAYDRPDAIVSGEPWAFYGTEWVADQIIKFAVAERIPSMFWEGEVADRGATIAFGVNLMRELGRAADQLARVLKGAKPADTAVDQATDFEIVVNRKAARALNLAIPASLATRANRLID